MKRISSLVMLLAFAGCDSAMEMPSRDFDYYLASPSPLKLVEVLSGRSNDQRREIVSQALSAAGISHTRQSFRYDNLSGENIVAEIGFGSKAGSRHILIEWTRPVLMTMRPVWLLRTGLGKLRADPPDHIRAVFLFSDLEETALAGSRHFVASTELSDVYGAVSFDLCGIGDAIGIWDVRGGMAEAPVMKALIECARLTGASAAGESASHHFHPESWADSRGWRLSVDRGACGRGH